MKFDGRRVFAKCLFLEKLNFDFNRNLYFFSIFPGILSDRMCLCLSLLFFLYLFLSSRIKTLWKSRVHLTFLGTFTFSNKVFLCLRVDKFYCEMTSFNSFSVFLFRCSNIFFWDFNLLLVLYAFALFRFSVFLSLTVLLEVTLCCPLTSASDWGGVFCYNMALCFSLSFSISLEVLLIFLHLFSFLSFITFQKFIYCLYFCCITSFLPS